MNKQQVLDHVNDEIIQCKICPVGKRGKPVVGEGNADADIVFINEAPGIQEKLDAFSEGLMDQVNRSWEWSQTNLRYRRGYY